MKDPEIKMFIHNQQSLFDFIKTKGHSLVSVLRWKSILTFSISKPALIWNSNTIKFKTSYLVYELPICYDTVLSL